MADDNKPLKYIRYAIGEIVLVMIGILLALQVNDWNEQRRENKMLVDILKEINNDLESDIAAFSDGIMKYKEKNELIKWGLGKTNYSINQLDSVIQYMIPASFDYKMVTKGFEKLKISGILDYQEYNALINEVNDYYTVQLNGYDRIIDWDIRENHSSVNYLYNTDVEFETIFYLFPTVLSEPKNIEFLIEGIRSPSYRNQNRSKFHRINYITEQLEKMKELANILRKHISDNID